MSARRAVTALALAVVVAHGIGGSAHAQTANAQTDCGRAVIFTLPGITWEDVAELRPPVLESMAGAGAIGSMSVRTNSSRTDHASGFGTIGAGTRLSGGVTTGGSTETSGPGATATGVGELEALAAEDGYDAVPGALGDALGDIPTTAIGNAERSLSVSPPERFGRWTLLTAMDTSGNVDFAAVGPELLEETAGVVSTDDVALAGAVTAALETDCGLIVIDQGDLIRAESVNAGDEERARALLSADELLGVVRAELTDEDLLLVVAPTSPAFEDVHFGVALAEGPGFPTGTTLASSSTRREGIVTLPDVAPTVLRHFGLDRHPAMLGRAFFTVPGSADRVGDALESDREAVFMDRVRGPLTTAFVIAQVAIYLLIGWALRKEGSMAGWPQVAALAVVAFPLATYLAGAAPQHSLGEWGYPAFLIAIDVVLLLIATRVAAHPLDRLLVLTGLTCAGLMFDVITGGSLQVNTAFSYSPLVAGRFSGFGNTAFSVLAASTLISGALIVQRFGRSRRVLTAVGLLFLAAVVVDGAPMWGSDVGGVLALVPAFGITLILLAGHRPRARVVLALGAAAVVAVAAFLAFDLARPEEDQTHLARLYEDVSARGIGALTDTIGRKIETNLRVFTSTIWTYFVPPALAFMAWLLLRPRNAWKRLAIDYPTIRAGLIGGLVLSVLGFAVNDSGIVVPAMILSFLVPVALVVHLLLDKESA
jgi:hypothetical protein